MKRVRLSEIRKRAMRRPRVEYFVEATYRPKKIEIDILKDREIYRAARLGGARTRNDSGSGFFLARKIRDIGFYFYREHTARCVYDVLSRVEGIKVSIKKSVKGEKFVRC